MMRCPWKRRFLLCVMLTALSVFFYVMYVPYDFTIGALAKVYSRCPNPKFSTFLASDQGDSKVNRPICQGNTFLKSSLNLGSHSPWIPVSDRKMVAYSAYFIERLGVVRVLVLKHVDECRPVLCYFHENSGDGDRVMEIERSISKKSGSPLSRLPSIGSYDLIRLDCWWDCEYFESFFIDCPVRTSSTSNRGNRALPTVLFASVSLLPVESSSCIIPDHLSMWPQTPITYIDTGKSPRHNLTVCIAPMFEWVDYEKVVIFIEYYRSQGATKFILYHRSWSKQVQAVIDFYRGNQSIIELEIVEWPQLPPVANHSTEEINIMNKHVSYNGQVLAMNDCGYRERYRSRYVAHVDLDEFIVVLPPRSLMGDFDHSRAQTLLALLIDLDQPDIGSFVFEHARLYSNDLAVTADHQLIDHLKNRYLNVTNLEFLRAPDGHVDHFPTRTKTIVKPEAVKRQGVHFVWTHESRYRKKIIANKLALFYHVTSMTSFSSEEIGELRKGQSLSDVAEMNLFRQLIKKVENRVNEIVKNSIDTGDQYE